MLHDLRFAIRQLLRSPGFTAVTVLTLALGLSVNAMLFNIANDLFFRPLPTQAPKQLVVVAQKAPAVDYQIPLSYPDYNDLNRLVETDASDLARVYTGLAAYKETPVHLSRTGVMTERSWIHGVTGNYFMVLGVQPQLGRFFLPSEGHSPGADPIVVLSDASWRNQFNADPTIVGQTIKINGLPLTVVGVAPVQSAQRRPAAPPYPHSPRTTVAARHSSSALPVPPRPCSVPSRKPCENSTPTFPCPLSVLCSNRLPRAPPD